MNLPNAAYTNAAHKNGVLSLGCIFLPRAYQSWRTLIQRDAEGNFPYADKLVQIAEYYGFDGWFVNLEGSDSPSGQAKTELQAMLAYMREKRSCHPSIFAYSLGDMSYSRLNSVER